MLCLSASLFGDDNLYDFSRADHKLVGVDTFQGDKYGDFAGDRVAILDDGSCWKIHPKDTTKFFKWKMNETMHVECREKDYWFSRQHYFYLVNHATSQKVRVMPAKFGSHAVKIKETIMTEASTWAAGNSIYCSHEKKVTLSDGSEWYIFGASPGITRGKQAYVSYHNFKNGRQQFFIIVGTGRDVDFHALYSGDEVAFFEDVFN